MATQPHVLVSRLKLAAVGASAAAAAGLAAAPVALASSPDGTMLTPAAGQARSAPFTIGLSDTVVKPGQQLTISGLAYARAGKKLTILSDAIASSRIVDGMPAVLTPALVEGTYRTIVRVPPATKAGTYPVLVRFDNRQVASTQIRVVAAGGNSGPIRAKGCSGIGFTVLHNDYAASAYLPAGSYTVSSHTMDCGTASADFTSFLAGAGKPIPGWSTRSPGAGRATFTQRNSGLSFSVARKR